MSDPETTDDDALIQFVAAAIWRDRYPDEDWEHVRWLAEDTEDGGNARYLTIVGHARAAVWAMIRWGVQYGR